MSREESTTWLLPIAATLTAVLVGWAILAASQTVARNFNFGLYLLINLVVFIDLFDFVLRLYFRKINGTASARSGAGTSVVLDLSGYTPYEKRLHLRPYALLVSVYNAEDHIDTFLESMEPFRDHLWIIDDGSTDNTCRRIRQAGWRTLAGGENRKKPGAIRRLLHTLPSEIETVVILDPDTTFCTSGPDGSPDGLDVMETVIFEFQRSGMAGLCPRLAIRRDGFLSRLEGLEYCLSFSIGRMSLADQGINSGISVYRRDALEKALEQHSLSVYAEDLEISTILLAAGERIYYDGRLVALTEGKGSGQAWFSQRVGWTFGFAKVYSEHFREIFQTARGRLSTAYQFLVYMGGFNLLLHPFRIVSCAFLLLSLLKGVDTILGLGLVPDWDAAQPVYFLAAFSKFTLLALAGLIAAVPRGERAYFLPIVPLYFFYSLSLIIPTTVGYADWIALRLFGRRILGDHYENEESIWRQWKQRNLAGAMQGR